MTKILKQVAQAIVASGATRYAIFKATGIDQGQLSKLMKGEAGLSIAKLEKLAEFLDLEVVIRVKRVRKKPRV